MWSCHAHHKFNSQQSTAIPSNRKKRFYRHSFTSYSLKQGEDNVNYTVIYNFPSFEAINNINDFAVIIFSRFYIFILYNCMICQVCRINMGLISLPIDPWWSVETKNNFKWLYPTHNQCTVEYSHAFLMSNYHNWVISLPLTHTNSHMLVRNETMCLAGGFLEFSQSQSVASSRLTRIRCLYISRGLTRVCQAKYVKQLYQSM